MSNAISQMLRLTIRATDESVPSILLKTMEERLAVGVSKEPEPYNAPTYREISNTFSSVMVE